MPREKTSLDADVGTLRDIIELLLASLQRDIRGDRRARVLRRIERRLQLDRFDGRPANPPTGDGEAAVPRSAQGFRAADHDLQAENEALRDTVEALEASNKELRSKNDELVSANRRLQAEVEARGRVNEALESLNAPSDTAAFGVDPDRRIERVTPRASPPDTSRERLKVAAATTRDFAIMVLDEQGLVTAWNAGAHRIFGYTEEEILGRPAAEIFTPEDRAHGVPEEEMRTALRKGRAEDERWHRRKDGSRFYCSGVMMRLDDTAGKGFAKIARDMTGTKQYELAQEHALFKQKRVSMSAQVANELKDKFLAVMSHELKQPLNLIQMNAELLGRLPAAQANPAVLRIGETVKRAVASQSRIIDDLLDLSRIRTGKLRLNKVTVDLCEVLHAVSSASMAAAPEKKLELDFQCAPTVACHGDRVRIEQIFWNLLSNAVKFTPSGGKITVNAVIDGHDACITIADTGRGIEKEFLAEVFGMFNQVDSSLSPASGGLGIGLALVQELTQAHGGRVQAHSAGLGQGAEFKVWLPAGEALVPQEQRPAAFDEISLRDWRVLLVDDYADGLLPFAEVLRLEGAVVDVADSAKRALEQLELTTYDLLISDIGMPEMDGYALIAEVRRRPRTRQLPAIAMTGYGRRTDARRALEAGFNAHVPKPTAVEDLKAAICNL